MKPRVLRLSRCLYAVMLRAYPSSFRREYSREMMLVFQNRARDVVKHGGSWALLPFMIRIVSDWLWTVAGEQTDSGAPCTLGLNGGGAVSSCGDADRMTRAVWLMLVILGVCLLIVGWYQWLSLMTARR
jgi:hypothetical protein